MFNIFKYKKPIFRVFLFSMIKNSSFFFFFKNTYIPVITVQSIIATQTILFIIHGYAAEIFLYIKYKKRCLEMGTWGQAVSKPKCS